jgi:hypothetical protein
MDLGEVNCLQEEGKNGFKDKHQRASADRAKEFADKPQFTRSDLRTHE